VIASRTSRGVALAVCTSAALLAASRPGSPAGSNGIPSTDPGTWRTVVIPSPSIVRVPPPPAAGTAAARTESTRTALAARHATAAEVGFWTHHPLDGWLDQAFTSVMASQPKDPPRAARDYAYVSVAIYDAVVAAGYWKRVYRRERAHSTVQAAATQAILRDEGRYSYPSATAAVAGAASGVLSYLFPEYPPEQFDLLATQEADAMVAAGAGAENDMAAGLTLGRRVAGMVIARARQDGSTAVWSGAMPAGASHWSPPPGVDEPPVEPLAGTWKTWFMTSGSQLRPGPPPAYGSVELTREARQVMRARLNPTPSQRADALFWRGGQGTPQAPGIWDQVALWYAERANLGLAGEARLLAVLNMAMEDAAVAVWDCKYHYWSPRPENVIRDLGLDPTWTSLVPTPIFPSYVSGHSAISAAAAEVLAWFVPRDAAAVRAEAWQAAMSRLYGGIHFSSDIVTGFRMGRTIGRMAVAWARHP